MVQATHPSSTAGDSLLNEVFALYDLVDSSSRLYQWYHTEQPEQAMKLAAQAEKEYLQQLPTLPMEGAESIECLRKLALAAQFQNRDFSYQKAFPPSYDRAIDYIGQAIALQRKMPPSTKLAELYETAARVAIPHFYFGYQSASSLAAEKRADDYLREACNVYATIGEHTPELDIVRSMKERDLKSLLRRIRLAESVEGSNSLALATDIGLFLHECNYQKLYMEDHGELYKYAKLGNEIFQAHELEEDQAGLYHSLLYNAGYFFATGMWNLDTSCYYLRKAQSLEQKWGLEVDQTAFQLAANHLQQQQWAEATKQYDIALTSPRVAIIDVEQAYFGKAMVAWISGDKSKAIQIWKQNIRDQEIMNGVSGYQSRFMQENKPMIRENALALIAAVGAPHAQRIVETGWEK